MCGIVGFVKNYEDEDLIRSFTHKISHRGPDNIGYTIKDLGGSYLHLGSARLSLRGASSENMPMTDRYKNLIVYNGEVFDINNLKNYLDQNTVYSGDTRMVLDLLSKDERKIKHINGMYALAFYNNKQNKLFLGRDKLGIKPLFYTTNSNNDLFFSSEMKTLIEFSGIKTSLNQESIKKILLFNGLNKKTEIINGLKSVEPGELISIDLNNKSIKSEKIFQIENNPDELNDTNFNELMTSVVSDHLIADTSVDLFLSGGIDSTILAYFTKKKLSKNLRHFSIAFENKSYDEEIEIKKIAENLSLSSMIFNFNDKNINEHVNEAITNMNSLVLDYSFVPTYLLSKKTSEYTKAVISGDGADELFGGYEWYRGIKYFNKLPYHLLKFVKKLTKYLRIKSLNGQYLTGAAKFEYFFKYLSDDPYIQMIIWQSVLQKFDEKRIQIISDEISKYIEDKNSLRDNLRAIDMNIYLYTNILPKVDIASMSNSLEVRPPYLDERVVNFAYHELNSNHVGYLNTKKYLRDFIDGTELNFINKMNKKGLGFPVLDWLTNYGLEEMRELFLDQKLIYLEEDHDHLSNLLFKSNLSSNTTRELWAYYVLSKWFLEINNFSK